MPQGIAEVTLFNQKGSPIAERLVYLNLDKKLNIKAELDKSQYGRKEKAVLKIKVTDEHGKPVVTHLGMSVFDKMYKNEKDNKARHKERKQGRTKEGKRKEHGRNIAFLAEGKRMEKGRNMEGIHFFFKVWCLCEVETF